MSPRKLLTLLTLIAITLTLPAGCPEAARLLPALNVIQVELYNDTDYDIEPNIRFDDDSNWLASLVPAETLTTGELYPGEIVTYNFDCDELGLILSHEAEQYGPFFTTYIADSTRTLEREDEYECGDLIRFRFVGTGDSFGVIVSVNGLVVD